MNSYKALENLDTAWSREKVLKKIIKGESPDTIVDAFINENRENIKIVTKSINQDNTRVLKQLENLTICEIKLLKELNKIQSLRGDSESNKYGKESKLNENYNLGLFMNKWSNKFVIGLLIMISLLSLTKQAWA